MRILHHPARSGMHAATLCVLLPGALQQPEEMIRAGFIESVRRHGHDIDLALADPDLQFMAEATDGTAVEAIHEELVKPAARHYRRLWLAGISLGGFMALAHAERYPGLVHGLCLLAPYPGNRMLVKSIAAAGGPGRWQPREDAGADPECRVWQWLKQRRAMPRLWLGYGADDRFASSLQMMAAELPAGRTCVTGGGHDWPTWRRLWDNFLASEDMLAGSEGSGHDG